MERGPWRGERSGPLRGERIQGADLRGQRGAGIGSDGVSVSSLEEGSTEGSQCDWRRAVDRSYLSIRFNIANVQRPLAAASKVVGKGNRVVMEDGGGYIENVATGERIQLRLDRGVYVFDVVLADGTKTGSLGFWSWCLCLARDMEE